LREFVLKQKTDIIINQWVIPFYATLVWKLALLGTSCKVFSVHHNKPDTNSRIKSLEKQINEGKKHYKFVRWAVREVSRLSLAFCINSSDKFILLSSSFIPVAKKYARVSGKDKLISIPNPVTITAPTEITPKEKEIIYVGRIEYIQKHTYRVIDIWRELEQKHPTWRLTIVGDGEERSDIERRIKEYGLERVTITGFVNPVEYYKRASILLLTSEYEGFGLVIVEAMTYGVVPVVYNSYETAGELITNGVNGMLVDAPYNVEAFTSTLENLMNNEDTLNKIACNAMNSSTRFSVDNIANEWYKLMEK
jgi:glycosyltransferase involved in cell wall biosynthesis